MPGTVRERIALQFERLIADHAFCVLDFPPSCLLVLQSELLLQQTFEHLVFAGSFPASQRPQYDWTTLDNPYAPSTPPDAHDAPAGRWREPLWIALALGIGVIVHYATASYPFWNVHPLMNCVLLTSPIAIACQFWIWFQRPTKFWLLFSTAASLCILIAFGTEWSLWFSPDPYQSFILANNYFGPYGWHPWLWVFSAGLMPLGILSRALRETVIAKRWLAVMILAGYLDNFIFVFQACHMQ